MHKERTTCVFYALKGLVIKKSKVLSYYAKVAYELLTIRRITQKLKKRV